MSHITHPSRRDFLKSSTVAVAGGQTNLNQDFGYSSSTTAGKGMVGDDIFFDANGDRLPEQGEGIPGVTVRLYDTADNLLATTVTDANGKYYFGDAAWDYVKERTGVDLKRILEELAEEVSRAHGK